MTFEHDPALPKTLADEGLGGPARGVVHVCRHTDGPRPWLVWVHGAGQGGTEDLVLSRIGRIHHKLGFQRRDAGATRPWAAGAGNGRPTRIWIRWATWRA